MHFTKCWRILNVIRNRSWRLRRQESRWSAARFDLRNKRDSHNELHRYPSIHLPTGCNSHGVLLPSPWNSPEPVATTHIWAGDVCLYLLGVLAHDIPFYRCFRRHMVSLSPARSISNHRASQTLLVDVCIACPTSSNPLRRQDHLRPQADGTSPYNHSDAFALGPVLCLRAPRTFSHVVHGNGPHPSLKRENRTRKCTFTKKGWFFAK